MITHGRKRVGRILLVGVLGLVTSLALAGYGLYTLRKFDSEGIV